MNDAAAAQAGGAGRRRWARALPVRVGDRLRRAYRWFRPRYLTIDPRTLGLFRITLGLMLILDGARHWREARWYYSNAGVLTNHLNLFRPSSGYHFSLFHAFSSPEEVHVAFAAALLTYACFTVGYRTRLFSVLSCLWVTSLDSRLVLVENGGYVVVNLMAFWAMFLPTGQRFSVDSLRRALRERHERSVAALDAPFRAGWLTRNASSIAALLLLVNLAFVYIFNVVNKFGQTWRDGLTVHYVLHIDRMVTGPAVLAREWLPFWATRFLTHFVLVHEALIAALILWPRNRLVTRPLAMLLLAALHLQFGLMMRLGPFSWFLIGWSVVLLRSEHWDAAARWYRRHSRPCLVALDPRQPLSLWLGRVLRRLDHLGQLRFAPAAPSSSAWLSVQTRSGETLTGRPAAREIVQALPGGRWLGPLLGVATLGAFRALTSAGLRRPDSVARWFGLRTLPTDDDASDATSSNHGRTGARGLPPEPPPPWPLSAGAPPYDATPERPHGERSPLGRTWRATLLVLREGTLGLLSLAAVSQALNENKSTKEVMAHTQPRLVQAVIQYPRIFQGWGMFSPNPVRHDGIVAVDAMTIDGRRVDPFTGREPDLDLRDARGLGLNQIRQDYFNRIRLDRNKPFRRDLEVFLQRYHHETGRAEDELVGYDVYWLKDHCPEPGHLEPYEHEAVAILSWRKPGYRPKPPLPPLPKRPKIESGEKE